MMLFSAVLLALFALVRGQWAELLPQSGQLGMFLGLMGLAAGSSVVLALYLVASTGAVFASLSAYAMTIAGIVWGMLLLNEELSMVAWFAFAVILIGMYLMEPKASEDELVIRRSFRDET